MNKYREDYNSREFKKPNIIMVMSEAYYDITEVKNLKLSKDPLENFHSYQKEFIGGNIITSVATGSTAQTEFEVLTGYSVNFTGENNIAYLNLIKNKTRAIPAMMKEEGYNTLAIHPYYKNFYSRDVVYPLLGIDEYISSDSFNNSKTTMNGFVTDMEVMDKIIREYELKNKTTDPFLHM